MDRVDHPGSGQGTAEPDRDVLGGGRSQRHQEVVFIGTDCEVVGSDPDRSDGSIVRELDRNQPAEKRRNVSRENGFFHGGFTVGRGERFDSFVRELMTARPAALAEVERHLDYTLAVPTAEHFLPLAYLAGLCSAAGEPAAPFAVGCALGSLSMTSYLLGMSPPPPRAADGVQGNAMPEHTPPEQTSI